MRKLTVITVLVIFGVVFLQTNVLAGAPFVNLEGVGGVAFNPLAYLADSQKENSHWNVGDVDVISTPRLGGWYVNLDHVDVDWTTLGVATTLFKKLEVSFGYETINQDNVEAKHKSNFGAKFLLLPENSFDTEFLPAISVGTIFKHTSNVGSGVNASGQDYYLVATKLIKQLPRPVLLSGGILSTHGKTTGVFGYHSERKEVGFANIDVVLPRNLIVGFEFREGPSYSGWEDANYWETHLAWTANEDLTLILAYVDAGDTDSSKVGLGNGVVLSAQYRF